MAGLKGVAHIADDLVVQVAGTWQEFDQGFGEAWRRI